jgi:hypothetical protein
MTEDKEWARRDRVIRGLPAEESSKKADEESAGAGRSTADRGDSPSFTGDGPAGESVTGGVEIADEDEKSKK